MLAAIVALCLLCDGDRLETLVYLGATPRTKKRAIEVR